MLSRLEEWFERIAPLDIYSSIWFDFFRTISLSRSLSLSFLFVFLVQIYLSIYLSIWACFYLSIYLSISFCLGLFHSVPLCISLSLYIYIYIYIVFLTLLLHSVSVFWLFKNWQLFLYLSIYDCIQIG